MSDLREKLEKLAPCPFCGGEASKLEPGGSVWCVKCAASCDSVDLWNRRALLATEGPGLREKILAEYDEYPSGSPEFNQLVDGKWYVPKWGCDQLDHVIDAALACRPAQRRSHGE